MNITVYKQENYPQELGTGQGYTIARYGCAETCLTSLCNWYNRSITPDQLNTQLNGVRGFSWNGTINQDGSKNYTLLKWGAITQIYGEIQLKQNIAYPSQPADMGMVDAFLDHGQPVIVGVSFLHNPKDTVPSHYVLIYRKNPDGSYQMMDPWFGNDTVFDKRYAVNGMSVANAILQVVAYAGPAPQVQPVPPVPSPAPETAHPQQAVTPEDVNKTQADANYNLYLQEVATNKTLNDRITELQQQVSELQTANNAQATEVANTKTLNSTLADKLKQYEANDSATIENLQKQIEALKEKEQIANATADALQTKPKLQDVLSGLDNLFSIRDWANKLTGKNPPKPQSSVLSVLGLSQGGEVNE